MDALGLIFRAELRRRWRSWLALAVLIAVVGGVVMASAAAGRRTASAFPSFVRTHGYDFVVFNGSPLPQLARYPAVASITTAPVAYNGQPVCACTHPIDNNNFNVVYVPPKEMSRTVNLVAGSMPNPSSPDEVLASFNLQRDNGVQVGTVLRMRMYAASQSEAVNNATGAGPPPTGPFVSFHVVGIEAAVDEFQAGTTALYDVYTTPAFARSVLPKTTIGVHLPREAAPRSRRRRRIQDLRQVTRHRRFHRPEYPRGADRRLHPSAGGRLVAAGRAGRAGRGGRGRAGAEPDPPGGERRVPHPPGARARPERPGGAGHGIDPARRPWSAPPGRWLSPTPSPRSHQSATLASPSRHRASASTDPSFCSARSPPWLVVLALGVWPSLRAARGRRGRSPSPLRRPSSGWWVRRVRRRPWWSGCATRSSAGAAPPPRRWPPRSWARRSP